MDISELYKHLRGGAEEGAKALLGWKLVRETELGRVAGYIVETEAYTQNDPASHTYKGITNRNAAMFEDAGTVYVYFTYGMHYCVNIVCGAKDSGEAVLIRALQPVEGLAIMEERRNSHDILRLTNGPAKVTQALGINKEQTGTIIGDTVHLDPGFTPEKIIETTRVGITKAREMKWRFYVADNPYISRK